MNSQGLSSYFQFSNVDWGNMFSATWETVWMTVGSMIIVAILGLALGLLLFETTNSHNPLVKALNWLVALFVNVFRSIPFIINRAIIADYPKIGRNDYRTTRSVTFIDHFCRTVLCSDG